jgi:hypothetical protein
VCTMGTLEVASTSMSMAKLGAEKGNGLHLWADSTRFWIRVDQGRYLCSNVCFTWLYLS